MGIAGLTHDEKWLEVRYTDGTTGLFLGSWLRDNIASGRHRSQGQRTFDINRLPEVTIAGASHRSDRVMVSFAPEGLTESFEENWLRRRRPIVEPSGCPTLWGSEMQDGLAFADFPSLVSDPDRLRDWLVGVRDLGFGLVENIPTTPGSILRVVDLFGYTRETNYGQLFDVREKSDPANLAYTALGIGMHTDNPYREPVPGLQLLHCLVNETDGGENQLCDGFAVAERIRRDHPEAFQLLTRIPVGFRFVEEGTTDLASNGPLIELDTRGEIGGIRYNSRSIQPFDMDSDVLAAYYHAYRLLGVSLHDPAAIIEFRLQPGQLVVFDNQRVLHGRSAYHRGERHLQGCYADKDSLRSRIRVLEPA